MLFFKNFIFFYFYLNSEGRLQKYASNFEILLDLPKNDTFCHIFLDSTLFHQFLPVLVPNIVNVGYFTLIKVRQNSGELKNMPFLVGQS